MKRNLRFLAGAFLLTATALFTGCNSDDDFLMNPQTDSVTPETRANFNDDGTTTITFDDFDETFMARFRLKQRTTTRFMDILQRTKSGKYTIPILCLSPT